MERMRNSVCANIDTFFKIMLEKNLSADTYVKYSYKNRRERKYLFIFTCMCMNISGKIEKKKEVVMHGVGTLEHGIQRTRLGRGIFHRIPLILLYLKRFGTT